MSVIEVDETNFVEEVINSETPVLVDFWAEWCGPCRQMAPILDELAEENEGKVTVAKLNVDENPSLAAQYRITGIPAMKLFKKGQIIEDLVGARSKKRLLNDLAGKI